jgi:uncharacterized membrane protein
MTTTTTDSLVADYLRQLEREARALPRPERDGLIAEIREHLACGLAPDASEADVRNLLDDLGAPADIVAAARGDHPPTRRGAREVFGVVLMASGFPPLLGWLVGVGLVLWSPLWTARQKLLGILVWPGGLTVAIGACLMLGVSSGGRSCDLTPAGRRIEGSCVTVDSGMHPAVTAILIAVVLTAPLVVGVYLYRAAGRGTDAT